METQTVAVLDLERLRTICRNDDALMRETLDVLVEDVGRQAAWLKLRIGEGDAERFGRLACYCKGACQHAGAMEAAETLGQVEDLARESKLGLCRDLLAVLNGDLGRLRAELKTLKSQRV